MSVIRRFKYGTRGIVILILLGLCACVGIAGALAPKTPTTTTTVQSENVAVPAAVKVAATFTVAVIQKAAPTATAQPAQPTAIPPTAIAKAAPTVVPSKPANKPAGTPLKADYNCTDFKTHAEAQRFFDAHGPGDPYGLDSDGDGIACEGLK